jgi:hypothetical protein
MDGSVLRRLKEHDGLREFAWEGKRIWLHEDHRWVLPSIWAAQEEGRLPRPTPVVLLDRHPDAAVPETELPVPGSLEAVYRVCAELLSRHDDDWIVAGMRMGILGDVWVYGVDDRMGDLPRREGNFVARGRWGLMGGLARDGVELPRIEGPYLLDVDLDCFAFAYRDRVWAWTEEMWDWEFGDEGASLWRRLLAGAAMVTVCREAGCCGGEENCEAIWAAAGRWLFGGRLVLVD